MRWRGMMMGNGLRPSACPTPREGDIAEVLGEIAIGAGFAERNGLSQGVNPGFERADAAGIEIEPSEIADLAREQRDDVVDDGGLDVVRRRVDFRGVAGAAADDIRREALGDEGGMVPTIRSSRHKIAQTPMGVSKRA